MARGSRDLGTAEGVARPEGKAWDPETPACPAVVRGPQVSHAGRERRLGTPAEGYSISEPRIFSVLQLPDGLVLPFPMDVSPVLGAGEGTFYPIKTLPDRSRQTVPGVHFPGGGPFGGFLARSCGNNRAASGTGRGLGPGQRMEPREPLRPHVMAGYGAGGGVARARVGAL